MATQVTFYALKEREVNISNKGIPSEYVVAADLALECVQARKKVTVLCATQAHAEAFDEFIWQHPSDSFIPHNLYGEGPDMGTPVEVIWLDAYNNMTKLRNTAMVINLSQHQLEKHDYIRHIVDFVALDEEQKVLARQRYKNYKMAGCQLEYKEAS